MKATPDQPSVGLSTLSLGGISVVAYVGAILAFIDGDRDEVTITAIIAGTVALIAMAHGRYSQAVAEIRKRPPLATTGTPNQAVTGTTYAGEQDRPA